ncbi:histidine phosphatase family protein, partial [Streptomyces sp. NPDC005093]
MTSGDSRRLVVLRHAKSAWPDDVADHERPSAVSAGIPRLSCSVSCIAPAAPVCTSASRRGM